MTLILDGLQSNILHDTRTRKNGKGINRRTRTKLSNLRGLKPKHLCLCF